ncbi:hypothetical protein LK03_09305 [Pseudomonas cremoricolorata]|uniref:Uncharacterized protein n=1 Tax=Pseudomonas cremoricolorata TaxID=157783 RepID=A0A089YCD2_9PSED|nr:hypothetical protein LK03_09305 [Pseudomonas cremoricolorata]
MLLQDLFIAAYVVIIASLCINLAITVYLAHRLTEEIESQLTNSKLIMDNLKIYASKGIAGKIHRLGVISLVFMAPQVFARKHLVDLQEINRIPIHTRKRLSRLTITCAALCVAFLSLWACVYFAKPYLGISPP